jgi:endoglucanase
MKASSRASSNGPIALSSAVLGILLLMTAYLVGPWHQPASVRAAPTFNYGEALQKAISFYEEQSPGPEPSWNRVPWIGDLAPTDGADIGLDLIGGWCDASDYVKLSLPTLYRVAMLSWGVILYRNAFVQNVQRSSILNNLRWAIDSFSKADQR